MRCHHEYFQESPTCRYIAVPLRNMHSQIHFFCRIRTRTEQKRGRPEELECIYSFLSGPRSQIVQKRTDEKGGYSVSLFRALSYICFIRY